MGKTALTREAAHWWTRTGLFPDGAVFVSLEGNPSPDRLIGQVGEALEGVDFQRREDRRKWLEDQLARRRVLIVWDNYESVLPAFNAGRPTPPELAELAGEWTRGGSRLLVTCRDEQVGFEAKPFPLDELSTPEGLMLLVGFLEEALQIDRALAAGALEPAWAMADSLRLFLERTGRGGEGAALMIRLDEKMGSAEGAISETAAGVARQSAWARAAADAQSAVDDLNRLLGQLTQVRSWDTRQQCATTLVTLGRIYCDLHGRPAEAIRPLEQAAELFGELEAEGKADSTNRAAALGDLANPLMALGRFDEAEDHARQALAIREQLNSPDTWQTLWILEQIATSRGDRAAAEEYRRRKEAARAEAKRRAGPAGLPQETVVALLQLALTARAQNLDLADALADAGSDDPAELLAAIAHRAPWLATHLQALATGAAQPTTAVPPQFADLIQQAWAATR